MNGVSNGNEGGIIKELILIKDGRSNEVSGVVLLEVVMMKEVNGDSSRNPPPHPPHQPLIVHRITKAFPNVFQLFRSQSTLV